MALGTTLVIGLSRVPLPATGIKAALTQDSFEGIALIGSLLHPLL